MASHARPARRRSTSPFARLLREARRRAGLSGRELAALANVPQPTIAAAELGRDPHHSTVQALVGALRTLDARALLDRPPTGALPVSPRQWGWDAAVHGFHAARVALDVTVDEGGGQRATLRVTGLRCTRGSLRDPARRKSVVGGIMVGPLFAAIRLLHRHDLAPGADLQLGDAGLHHEFRLDRKGERLDYACSETVARAVGVDMDGQAPHGRPFARGCALSVDVPARSVVIHVSFAGRDRPAAVRPEAWPGSLAMDAGSPWTWPALYPHAARCLTVSSRGVARLQVDDPPAGLCFGLSWEAPGPAAPAAPPSVVRPDARRPVKTVLHDLRVREGLSARAMAQRLDMSPSSVLALERGGDPRLSTLRRYADAFPSLGSCELFQPHAPDGHVGLEEAWEWQRALFGAESLEDVTDCAISAEGNFAGSLTTRGLTWTSAVKRELRLRHGIVRVPDDATWNLESVHARAGEARVRVLRRGKGQIVHNLTLTRTGPARVSFTRRLRGKGQFALRKSRAWHQGFGAPRVWEAFYAEPSVPTRRLSLVLRFPRGYWPARTWAPVVPKSVLLVEGADDVAALVHGAGFRFTEDRARSTLRIDVDKPLLGLRYLIVWWLE